MAREKAFKVEGVIVETLPNRTCWVRLANGHRVRGFVAGKAKEHFVAKAGDKVKLQMSPYDLSEGRIMVETEKKHEAGMNG